MPLFSYYKLSDKIFTMEHLQSRLSHPCLPLGEEKLAEADEGNL
jgi:hypothetical protein